MAMIENVSQSWASVTLAANEGWMVREGAIYLSEEASGADDRGVRLNAGDAWPLPSGSTVYYRAVGGEARIARMVTI